MISLRALAELAEKYSAEIDAPVKPLRIGDQVFDTDVRPVVMGTVNLSRDSTYRESIAPSAWSAVRKARVQTAQGADCVDIGAESSTASAARVSVAEQIDALLPVVEALAADGVVVSVESYEPEVVQAALQAGARIVNLTGSAHDDAVFELVASHEATLILCLSTTANVREISDVETGADPFPGMIEHFSERIAVATDAGVDRIAVDPGLGFYYGNLVDPVVRARYQSAVILRSFRLRTLGLPVCHAMPHAFDLFEDEFRSAEAFFSVIARLGGTGVFRTHEVPRVRAVLDVLETLSVD